MAFFYACSAPPIGSDLPSNSNADAAFKLRLHEKFPLGSLGEDLTRELQREGFKRMPDFDGKHMADFVRWGFPCGLIWRVIWATDATGKLTSVDGLFSDTGCP